MKSRQKFDSIVVGLGGAGSSTAFHLSSRGQRTLGLEQFGPVHSHGSSHGRTRIYRTAYSEGTEYVPLTRRAQELWRELETATGDRILRRTGGLYIGRRDNPAIAGAIRSANAYSLQHEVLGPSEVARRFPQFVLEPDEVAVWDPEAGALFPENCIRAYAAQAVEQGAELHYGEAVESWAVDAEGVEVRTREETYHSHSLVLSSGPWTAGLVADLALPLVVERQFVLWFPSRDLRATSPDRMPVFLWNKGPGLHTYGLPDFGDGVKVGSWAGQAIPRPEDADRVLREGDASPIRDFVARCLRGVEARESESASCLYTNAPDGNFVLGRHPKVPRVTIVSACSGHGFKFASVVGELAAQLVCDGRTELDISLFDPGRFRSRARTTI